MQIAQKLYEAGHITYMRTDQTTMSEEAVEQAKKVIESKWGKPYVAVPTGKPKKDGKGAPVQYKRPMKPFGQHTLRIVNCQAKAKKTGGPRIANSII